MNNKTSHNTTKKFFAVPQDCN